MDQNLNANKDNNQNKKTNHIESRTENKITRNGTRKQKHNRDNKKITIKTQKILSGMHDNK